MKRIVQIGLLAFLLPACAVKVVNFTNDAARFSSYQSFAVVNYKSSDKDLSAQGSQIMSVIRQEIQEQMQRRGYVPDGQNPDVLVRYELISNQVTETSVSRDPYYSRTYYYPDRYFTTRTFLESALLIEITDRDTNKLVWQASLDLNKYTRKKNDQEILENAINEIFNTYLYRAGAKSPDESLIVERK